MDVYLPNTEREFADPNYWKKFFERNSAFEWYGDYSKLNGIFGKYIRSTDAILQIGCGNSTLADDLHDNGFQNVHSIDTDTNVIARQQKRNSIKRPTLKFDVCSAAEIGFISDQSINVVIDKGTLDALLPHNYNSQDENTVRKMMAEIERCLAPFGRYIIVRKFNFIKSKTNIENDEKRINKAIYNNLRICPTYTDHIIQTIELVKTHQMITLAQQQIIEKLFAFFGTSQFMIRLQKCEFSEADFIIPVFVVIITKFKTALNQRRKFEYLNSIQSQPEPMENFEKLLEKVRSAQQINWFKHYISRGPVEETSVKIYSIDGAERYELFMVDDQTLKTLCKYGVFIVPLGRENDWLFATPKGRTILRKNCELHRMIVVRLFRNQSYPSLEKIQEELNSIIIDFMPKAFNRQRVNYLSLGTTDVTTQKVEFGTSKISGDWSVEHVSVNDLMYRRLIFLNSSNLVQTEAEIQNINGKWQINWSNNPLCCEHHKHVMIAFEFICDENGKMIGFKKALKHELRLVVLGLGGGIISKVLHDTFEKSTIVGVELDKTIADIAVRHFDFPENSERMNVKICDAYKFLEDSASTADDKFDAIIVDLSGPVNEHGLYCPPPNFVTEEALNLMRKSLTSGGVLTLNLVTRDDKLAESVKKQLAEIFNTVYYISGDEDINEVILCSMMPAQKFAAHLEAAKKKRRKKTGKKLTHTNVKLNNNNGKGGKNDEEEIATWLMDCFAEMDKIHHFSI